jgi:hypothetical protein
MSEFLYYYTDQENKKRIMESGKLTLSPIANTNDPFECVGGLIIESLAYKTKNLDEDYMRAFIKTSQNPKARYLCMSLNHPMSPFGQLMWRRYADALKGACIVIQTKFQLNNIVLKKLKSDDWHHGYIKYLPTRDMMKGTFKKEPETVYHGISPFGIKDVEWAHEREYRFAHHNSNEKFPYLCDKNFPLEIIGCFEYEKDENEHPTERFIWYSKSQHPPPELPQEEIWISAGKPIKFIRN